MGLKAVILGFEKKSLTENQKQKIKKLISSAVINHDVSDFYFTNDDDLADTEDEENLILKSAAIKNKEILGFIANEIKEYKNINADVRSAMIVARPCDNNFDENLFDEVIQGFYIYYGELDCEDSLAAYDARDLFLAHNIDIVFWYSNPILTSTSLILMRAKEEGKKIILV